ncbi:hypothetical protein OF829_00240 [Sphingomonas sp. LB-2]|uniref:hypothetical protein n=1 Tax=Sphingomonas caeni TaxID=2984949 RepID=UPI00222F279D|nr:hypothetical protein [Sphingomonas caeni]MCW3845650.1 hypothetical protein [Sphingomonas caeni]
MTTPSRYDGKPFLRLLDCYVMDAIGFLDPEDDEQLRNAEPKLRAAFGLTGSWREMVVARMNFPAGMQGALRELWEKGRPKFIAANGFEPNPWDFTIQFIDTKFPH